MSQFRWNNLALLAGSSTRHIPTAFRLPSCSSIFKPVRLINYRFKCAFFHHLKLINIFDLLNLFVFIVNNIY